MSELSRRVAASAASLVKPHSIALIKMYNSSLFPSLPFLKHIRHSLLLFYFLFFLTCLRFVPLRMIAGGSADIWQIWDKDLRRVRLKYFKCNPFFFFFQRHIKDLFSVLADYTETFIRLLPICCTSNFEFE